MSSFPLNMKAKTVLVADDDPGILFCIVTILEDHGFNVLQAKSEEELLKHASLAELWIVDARLPTNGYEGILAVAELHDKGIKPDVPIIFMSVDVESFALQRLSALKSKGINYEWLEKPFELQYLLQRVSNLFKSP